MNLKKSTLKIVRVIILIIQWKPLILITEYVLFDEKKYKNILIYEISWKSTFMGSIPFRIRFNKIDGFIKIYDGIRYHLDDGNIEC